VLETKRGISALKLEKAGKFLWRPDIRARLNEWVADFALAGQGMQWRKGERRRQSATQHSAGATVAACRLQGMGPLAMMAAAAGNRTS
jgi:hypothetical protein